MSASMRPALAFPAKMRMIFRLGRYLEAATPVRLDGLMIGNRAGDLEPFCERFVRRSDDVHLLRNDAVHEALDLGENRASSHSWSDRYPCRRERG